MAEDLKGAAVSHARFGKGTIKSVEERYFTVEFDTDHVEKTFQYPDAFEKFIKAEDPAVEKMVKKDLQAAIEERQKEEAEMSANIRTALDHIEEVQKEVKDKKKATKSRSRKTDRGRNRLSSQ